MIKKISNSLNLYVFKLGHYICDTYLIQKYEEL